MDGDKVTIVRGDDWMGVYIDNYLAYQGHSISTKNLLELLKISHSTREADNEWLEGRGDLPVWLGDVQVKK